MDNDEIEFANKLLDMLETFHEWQLEHTEKGKPPYSYNTLGLAEWLQFNYFAPPKEASDVS